MKALDTEVSVQDFLDYAIINSVNVAELSKEESERIMNELKLNKRQNQIKLFVARYHKTKDGLPRAITAPKEADGLWYTRDPRDPSKKLRAKDEMSLYEKLYEIYSEGLMYTDFTVRAWYDIGVAHRKNLTNPQPSTFERHDRTKKAYFTEKLLDSDVRDITSSFLWSFLRETQEKHNMSLSETKQLKGTLNLVFQAAADPEIGCRDNNPLLNINPAGLFKNNSKAIKNNSKKTYSAFSDSQIDAIRDELRQRISSNRQVRYDRCKYALMALLASYTGMRASELPALLWDDVKDNHLHIHQMQVRHDGEHGKDRFEIVPWLKEEKGQPRGGRIIPFLDSNIPDLLADIKKIQKGFGIKSKWIFPDSDSMSYERSLSKVCKKLGYDITNNHAFRKGFNMWMLNNGLNVADRAAILGHSTTVNLEKYTVTSDNWVENTIKKFQVTQGDPSFSQISDKKNSSKPA